MEGSIPNNMLPNKLVRTTRMTSPEPTGAAKWLQDMWDKKRNEQVKTYMTYDTKTAVLNFAATLRRGINTVVAEPDDKIIITSVMGSYNRTDRGDKKMDKFLEQFISRIGSDPNDYITKFAKANNVEIATRGVRETGCMVFGDRREPIDPTTGIEITEAPDEINHIETMYVVLVREMKK